MFTTYMGHKLLIRLLGTYFRKFTQLTCKKVAINIDIQEILKNYNYTEIFLRFMINSLLAYFYHI